MDEEEEKKKLKILKKCSPHLMKSMNPDSILPALYSRDLLNSDEMERLSQASKTTRDKNLFIVLAVPTKGSGAFDRFVESLKETSEENPAHNELVRLLLNQESQS